MADQNEEGASQGGSGTEEPDYKALYEQSQKELGKAHADAEKWRGLSRKNAGSAKDLEQANNQISDLSERLTAIEEENKALKATAERTAMVAKVAKATGVPESIVETLGATDEKGLTVAAKAIADNYKTPGGAPSAPEAGTHVHAVEKRKAAADKFAELFEQQLGK